MWMCSDYQPGWPGYVYNMYGYNYSYIPQDHLSTFKDTTLELKFYIGSNDIDVSNPQNIKFKLYKDSPNHPYDNPIRGGMADYTEIGRCICDRIQPFIVNCDSNNSGWTYNAVYQYNIDLHESGACTYTILAFANDESTIFDSSTMTVQGQTAAAFSLPLYVNVVGATPCNSHCSNRDRHEHDKINCCEKSHVCNNHNKHKSNTYDNDFPEEIEINFYDNVVDATPCDNHCSNRDRHEHDKINCCEKTHRDICDSDHDCHKSHVCNNHNKHKPNTYDNDFPEEIEINFYDND